MFSVWCVQVLSGVSASDLRAAAGHLARASTLLSTCLQGVYQTHQATASACAVNNLHLLLGQLGRPGAGVLQMNGQPTAQNNREAGCNGEFPGFRNYQNPAHMRDLARLWNVSESRLPTWHVPTHVSEMLEYIEEGTMKLFWVSGTNPLVSLPHLAKIRDIFKKGDAFMVVQVGGHKHKGTTRRRASSSSPCMHVPALTLSCVSCAVVCLCVLSFSLCPGYLPDGDSRIGRGGAACGDVG